MACYFTLESGGHLTLENNTGGLLLEVCNDGVQVLGGGIKDHYYDRVRQALKERDEAERKLADNKKSQREAQKRLEEEERKLLEERRLSAEETAMMLKLEHELLTLEQERLFLISMVEFWAREEDDLLVILYSLQFIV